MSSFTLTPKDPAEQVALFRSEIIGALSRREFAHGQLREELVQLSQTPFRPPGADRTRRFSIPTLERWLYDYRRGGLSALCPKPRSDRGHAQTLSTEQQALLCDIRREHPTASAAVILRTLILDGRIEKDALSESTLGRFFKEKGLDRHALAPRGHTRARLRWQAERPGALWHGDVCHAPNLRIGGVLYPVRIHALLDDASRYVVALQARSTEKESDMLELLVGALRRHGAPDALYLDNGATYRGDALRLGCERLGITLLHARPYDAPARGKMERFWRTLRQSCLDFLGELSSHDDVNLRLRAFLDQHYHRAPHGALLGKSPAQIYAAAEHAPDALTESKIKSALTMRDTRRVRRDSTLSLAGTDYEIDQSYLCGRLVTVVRCLVDGGDPPYVEHEGQRLVLHPVDAVKNSRRKRKELPPPPTSGGVRSLPFDPPGALLDRWAQRIPNSNKEPSQ
jgi:putative transposase